MTNWCDNVLAPVDSNGRVVPLDTRELVYRGETHEVYGFSFDYNARHGRRNWSAVFENNDVIRLNACTMPDSWEMLEEDTKNAESGGSCGYFGREDKPCNESCPGFKGLTTPCSAIALEDAVRRAKALAGVSEND